jgi:hypothetical protein
LIWVAISLESASSKNSVIVFFLDGLIRLL